MGGISSAIGQLPLFFPLDILIDETEYSISVRKFKRGATETELQSFTKGTLDVFRKLEKIINQKQRLNIPCREQLKLTEDERDQHLIELAKWGRRAYRQFFKDDAQQALNDMLSQMQAMGGLAFAPSFMSTSTSFPWEILYDGDYRDGNPDGFWGLSYPVARDLTPGKRHCLQQDARPNMLFCLHHKLLHAHQEEQPAIEQLMRRVGSFYVLQASQKLRALRDGEALIEHLYQSQHNIFHFACHCKPGLNYEDEVDALRLSLICDGEQHQEIDLETYNFEDIDGSFQCKPLVFLNACKSAGGPDDLRRTFNLPRKFVDRGAAAVVATACDMPDVFAAAFAKVFYDFFIGEKMMIGQALMKTRWYFLEHYNNPLGLAYGLYSPAAYRLDLPPALEGVA